MEEIIQNEVPFIVLCPHCKYPIVIQELNCRIFRHGSWKHNGQQIDPHSPKEFCDEVVKNGKIYGCGKPFLITEKLEAVECDYI